MRPITVLAPILLAAWMLPSSIAAVPAPQSSPLDRVIPATTIECQPGPNCVWLLAEMFGLPVGVELDRPFRSLRDQQPLIGGSWSSYVIPRFLGFGAPDALLQFPAMTVRELLDKTVEADPRYEWREMNGVGVMRLKEAWGDSDDLLNRRYDSPINLTDVTLIEALHVLCAGRRTSVGAPIIVDERGEPVRFSVQFKGGSFLDAIDAVLRAHGDLAWRFEHYVLTYDEWAQGRIRRSWKETHVSLDVIRSVKKHGPDRR